MFGMSNGLARKDLAGPRPHRRSTIGLLAGVTVVGLVALIWGISDIARPQPTEASFSGSAGRIVFASDRDTSNDEKEIYSANKNGTDQSRLTINECDDELPSVNKGATWIVFSSNCGGDYEIFKMKISGSNRTQLTDNDDEDRDPSWDLSGTKIVFESNRGNADPNDMDLYTMNADGTGQAVIPNAHNHPTREEDPSWSGCTEIAYIQSTGPGFTDHRLRSINPDGTNDHFVFPDTLPLQQYQPDWSPDCSKIAFAGSDGEIYVVLANSTTPLPLTPLTSAGVNSEPVYSPAGDRIAFTSTRDLNTEIYDMNVDGSNQKNRTRSANGDASPSWGAK
jgi:TolB protein